MQTTNNRAVIYARYSSHQQTEQSIEGQLRDCHTFAERHGYNVVYEYIDRAKSAKTDHRPDFQRMIKDSEKHIFDVIIVWKLDRFARNRYDSASYKAKLKKHGVQVISAMENITQNAEGILMESLLEGMAEYFSAELSEKVRRGMRETALKCRTYGTVPFGYKSVNNKFAIDEDRAPVVKYIFETYAYNSISLKEILQNLKQKGIKNQFGRDFSKNVLQNILKNPRYKGIYKYADIEIPGGMPRIIDDKTFELAQKRLKFNAERGQGFKAKTKYILSDKLYCGYCKSSMHGECGTSRNGQPYFYYVCQKRKNKPSDCKKKRLHKEYIENLIINNILDNVLTDETINLIADNVTTLWQSLSTKHKQMIEYLNARLKETETSISNIMRAIEQGVFTSTTANRLKELEAEAENLRFEIDTEKSNSAIPDHDEIIYLLEQLREGDPRDIKYRQKLIDTFIYRIYAYDDKLIISYNYSNKNGEQQKSLSELCSDSDQFGSPYISISEHLFFYGYALINILHF